MCRVDVYRTRPTEGLLFGKQKVATFVELMQGQETRRTPQPATSCPRKTLRKANSMPRTIQLAASLPAPPERLFDMYLDPAEHAAFTGHPVTISAVTGSSVSRFNESFPARFCKLCRSG